VSKSQSQTLRPKGQSLALQVALLVIVTAVFTKVLDVVVVLALPPAEIGITLHEALKRAAPIIHTLDNPSATKISAKTVSELGDSAIHFDLTAAIPPAIDSPVSAAFAMSAAADLGILPERIRMVEYHKARGFVLPPPPGYVAVGAHGRTISGSPSLVTQSTAGELILEPAPTALAVKTGSGWLVIQDAGRGEIYWGRHAIPTLIIACAILLPMVVWQSRRIASQIKRFAVAVEHFGRSPDAPPMAEPVIRELGPAVRAFNEMKDRIGQLNTNRVMMMAAVSHDIRTPLARIRFRIAPLETPIRNGVSRDIAQIDKFIDELLALTRDTPSPSSQSAFDLSALVQSAVDELSDSGAEISFVGPSSRPVLADLPAVRRVINNLLDNALKYGGRTEVTLRDHAGRCEILVHDDGPGIPKGSRAVIFEPFQRLEPSRNRSTGGSGLGLAIARHLARSQNGDVELLGEHGAGATFIFWLPLSPAVLPAREKETT
jgi:signal transduction histidine kinase